MRKKKENRGFTIVELVIVIAVIAILAAVLIPTFSGVVDKANQSSYLQLAKNTLTEVIVNNDGSVEDGTYIFVSKDDTNVAWYQYTDGKLNALDAEPDMNNINLAFPITNDCADYLEDGVKVYRPIITSTVDKLNGLLDGTAKENYEAIADAGNSLTDIEMACINWGRKTINSDEQTYKFSFAYDRDNNKVYVLNADDSAVVYPTTGYASVPAKYRYLTGANINNETDLLEFSKITNEWTASELVGGKSFARPNEKNLYMAHNASEFEHAPLVILNLNNNIDMTQIESLDEWEPIANWYCFGNSCNATGDDYSNCYDISLLVNGNEKSFNNLSRDVLFGSLRSDSVLKDFEIEYSMGTSTVFYDITHQDNENNHIGTKLNSKSRSGNNYWNFGIAIRSVRNVQCSADDFSIPMLISNITLSGNCYVSNRNGDEQSGCDSIGIIALICSEKYGGGEGTSRTGANRTKVNFVGCHIFANSDDNYYKTNLSTPRELFYNMENDGNCCNLFIDGVESAAGSKFTFGD